MATYFVKKTTDSATGAFPGVRVDAVSPQAAVSAFAAMPGHALSSGDVVSVYDLNAIGFYSAVLTPTVVSAPAPALPPIGS